MKPSPESGDRPAEGEPVRVAVVPPEEHGPALRLLLSGSRHGPDALVQPFLRFVEQQGVTLDLLHGGYGRDGRLRAACLILPGAGRTGMVFVSPTPDRRSERITAETVRGAAASLSPERFRLLQALLEPTQIGERRALERAGFAALATLVYMQRPADRAPAAWAEGDRLDEMGLDSATWSESARPLFARTIEESYLETRDCPDLVGSRSIDDVIAGHMATGRFDPRLWRVYHRNGEPVAVVLLAPVQGDDTYELVYLGVCQAHRGRGLGEQVLKRGLREIANLGAQRICLAVDQDNAPARRLYAELGFRAISRKIAMIITL